MPLVILVRTFAPKNSFKTIEISSVVTLGDEILKVEGRIKYDKTTDQRKE